MRRLALVMMLALGASLAGAAPRRAEPEDIDRVVVASVLLSDGHADRALVVLEEVDLELQRKDKDFDESRYWYLLGRAQFGVGATADAVTSFQKAVDLGTDNTDVYLYLAQAQQSLGEHEAALATLDRAGEAVTAIPGGFMLRARSLKALKRYDEAFATLQAGRDAFPDEVGFDREQLYLLIELELYQEARTVGARYLERQPDSPQAWIAVGEALRKSGRPDEAVAILEGARVRFPDQVDAYTRLAVSYVDMGLPGACGTVLQQAAELDATLAAPAADCFRDAGRLERAFYMNSRVPEARAKAQQRLDLLVRAEEWDQAISLVPRLERLGLMDEDPVAYAVAYVQFQVGHYDRAEDTLKSIEDAQLFRDAAALRKAMADCQANPGGCI